MTRLAPFAVCVSLFAAGCTQGAAWRGAAFTPGYQPPRRISIFVLRQAAGEADVAETATLLGMAMVEEFAAHGIPANVVSAPPPPPAAHVVLVAWDPGSRAARYFAPGAGRATAIAVVDVRREPDGAGAMRGKVEGYLNWGMWGGESTDAARQAGRALAKGIATGRTWED